MPPDQGGLRVLQVVSSRIDLDDTSGRVLFPSMVQGPWLPFLRFAETRTTRAENDPGGHPHRREEVMNYILEGHVEYEDDLGRRSLLGPGTVAFLTAGGEARHNLIVSSDAPARWLSVVIECPPSSGGPSDRVQIAPNPAPAPAGDGCIGRRLVGSGSPVLSRSGLACTDVELREGAQCARPLEQGRRAVAYVYEGSAWVDDRLVETGNGALLENATETTLRAETGARVLFASAPRSQVQDLR
jgi:redox-sensitive bicupin YhaK (pirin superfamily)